MAYLTDGSGTNIGSAVPTVGMNTPNGDTNVPVAGAAAQKSTSKSTTTPTVLSDTNIRDNVIPNIQQKASTMLDYNANPYYIRPGESMEAYKDRTGITASLAQNGQQNGSTGTPDAPANEYEDIYSSVFGQKPQQDTFYDSDLAILQQMQKTSDARTSNALSSINAQFDKTRQDAAQAQGGNEATTRASLLRSGASRYAPTNAAGIMNAEQRGYVRELSTIDLQESQAKNEALAAQSDNDYKLLGEKLDVLKDKRQEKLDTVNKMYDTIIAQKKQTQQDITKLVEDAAKNGAPAQITNSMASAQNVGEAMEAAGDYLQTASGTPGEYLYYKRDAIAHGQVPMSYNDYADMDANRKRSIVNNYAGGLSNTQLTKATTIADQFKNEQTIKDYQTIAQGVTAFQSLGDSPADDIQRIYTFAKTMDPNSAVREGEYNTVQQYAQAYLPTLGIKVQRLVDNRGFLTDEARSMMQASLQKKFAPVQKNYESIRGSYADRINKITGNEDGKEFLTDYTIPADPVQVEAEAQQSVISYGRDHPEYQEQIRTLMGATNEETGQPYTSVEIEQILGIQ